MISVDQVQDVGELERVLRQRGGCIRSLRRAEGYSRDGIVLHLQPWNAPVHVPARVDLVVRKPRIVPAKLVQQRWSENVILDQRPGGVQGIKDEVGHWPAEAAGIAAKRVQAGDVIAEGDGVLLPEVVVDSEVVLVSRSVAGIEELRELEVGDSVEPAAQRVRVLPDSAREGSYVNAALNLAAGIGRKR